VRLALGPSIPDRVVALDTTAVVAVGITAPLAVVLDQPVFLDVAIVVALIAFVGTVAFAQYLSREAGR
jgi:multicomponent Na+:H+ antiporter subunit F